jgi:predicted  nucleic acid-binding Zn-ribbon protein
LIRCRQFLHVLDEQRDRVAEDAAAAIVAEEREMSAAGNKDVHSQLVHALEIARKEALQLREERRQRLIDQNRMRGEIKALQARVDQLQAAQAGAPPLSDELMEIAREQMKNV